MKEGSKYTMRYHDQHLSCHHKDSYIAAYFNTILNCNLIINYVQWTLSNPTPLGPKAVQITEIFGFVKQTTNCLIYI